MSAHLLESYKFSAYLYCSWQKVHKTESTPPFYVLSFLLTLLSFLFLPAFLPLNIPFFHYVSILHCEKLRILYFLFSDLFFVSSFHSASLSHIGKLHLSYLNNCLSFLIIIRVLILPDSLYASLVFFISFFLSVYIRSSRSTKLCPFCSC
jgi:hypothetical protein